jgi:hypothetical protein
LEVSVLPDRHAFPDASTATETPDVLRELVKQLLPRPQSLAVPEMSAEYTMRSPAADIFVRNAATVPAREPGRIIPKPVTPVVKFAVCDAEPNDEAPGADPGLLRPAPDESTI